MECCLGPFEITQLDVLRLRAGLARLAERDGGRAAAVRKRAAAHKGEEDEACPALDPATGTCDLYDARPVTCRLFGPAMLGEEGAVGACELCYVGASDEEIAGCAVEVDDEGLECRLVAELESLGITGATTVVAALTG
jgi:Fe-S-cluster containining protein